MLTVDLYESDLVAVLTPNGKLSENDFKAAARIIDPFIEEAGQLNGILIHVDAFPGWDSFSSLISHFEFVKEHHKKILRVAFATNSPIGNIAETLAAHFINAQIKRFTFNEKEQAIEWLVGATIEASPQ